MRAWRMLAFGGCVLAAMAATSSASAATTVRIRHPSILDTFTPQGIIAGHWRLIESSVTVHVTVPQTLGCYGSARSWQRQDGVQIQLLWALCDKQEMAGLRQTYALGQAHAPAFWSSQSALGAYVDLVQLAPADRIWRYWLQGDLNVAIETGCQRLSVSQCARLAVPAAKYLAARLPGTPEATPPTSVFPPAAPLLGAIATMALLFVGGNRLRRRGKLEKFEISTGDPRIHRVSAIASRLRKVNRRRWWGKLLAVVSALAAASAIFSLVHGSFATVALDTVLTVACGVASRALFRSNRDQALPADIPYALYLGRRHAGSTGRRRLARRGMTAVSQPPPQRAASAQSADVAVGPGQLVSATARTGVALASVRRLAGLGFIVLLGLLSIAAPALVLLGWLIAGLTGSAQDVSSILAVMVIAAVGVGYFIDRAAQRLIARQVQDAMRHDQRPYFLYLRNFGDDAQKITTSRLSRRGIWQRSTAWLNPVGTARFEEVLTQALAHSGPIIAVSPQNTKLSKLVSALAPPLGAAKTILPDNVWQNQVREWATMPMQEHQASPNGCLAVVVSATPAAIGPGTGFAKELKMLAEQVPHRRIILVFGTGKKAVLHHRVGGFLREVSQYPLFHDLATGWVTDGVLIMVHTPALDGTGSWQGWGAERRTAWTYTAAVGAALKYAQVAWANPPVTALTPAKAAPARPSPSAAEAAPPSPSGVPAAQDPLRDVELTEPVMMALGHASIVASNRHRPMDTKMVMVALMAADVTGHWERIWLETKDQAAIERTAAEDPASSASGFWNKTQLTGACQQAFSFAADLARRRSLMPLPPGVLALGLISDLSNAACAAMGIAEHEHQARVARLIQEMLGVTLSGLNFGQSS